MKAGFKWLITGGLLATLLGASGCALVRKSAEGMLAPMAAQISEGLMCQEDVKLVEDGAPAFLLLLDSLAEAHPDNADLQFSAAQAQLAYATGFVDRSDKARGRIMYGKARDYGLRAMALRNKRFAREQGAGLDDFSASLQSFRSADAPVLFTTASAWMMWIISCSSSPAAIGELPRVLAIMERVRELDPDIQEGGVDLFYGIYYTVLPLGGGRDLEKARDCFERSIEVAGTNYLLPQVSFAEFYARYAFDQELFESTLNAVLAAEPEEESFALMNAVAKKRAAALLENMEDLF